MVLCIVVFQLVNSCIPVQESKAQLQVSFQVFYDELSPHGNWLHHNRYGYVWSPGLSSNFFPYGSNGYWMYTNAGWTWISDYSWGWAPFHYGRWFLDNYYGWVWVPGYEWAPAWVVWRSCDGYYGWTPWEPEIGMDLAFAPHYHHEQRYWRFVRRRDMGRNDIVNHFEGIGQYIRFLNQSNVIDNKKSFEDERILYHAGPVKEEVESFVGNKIPTAAIMEENHPGQSVNKDQVILFKPKMEKPAKNQPAPQPQKVSPWKQETKPINEHLIEKSELPVQQTQKPSPVNKQIEKINPPVTPEKPAIQRPIPTPQKVPAPIKPKVEIRQAPAAPQKNTGPTQKQAHPIDERPTKPLIPKGRPTESVDSCFE